MIVSVVACGESASEWYKTPCDLSIGVNDCRKWNHPVDQLILINNPKSFTKERLEVIKSSNFEKLWVHNDGWKSIFPEYERMRLQSFSKHLKKGHIYSSKTSQFVGISLAFNQGATDIILHGHDLVDHPTIKGKLLDYEMRNTQNFARMLADQGTKVWLGKDYGALKNILNVWPPNKEISLTLERVGLNQDDVDKLTDAFNL